MSEAGITTSSDSGPSRKSHDFLDLLHTAADPSSSSLSSDELASVLGIAHIPQKEELLINLERNFLAPVKDLGGHELWRWQV